MILGALQTVSSVILVALAVPVLGWRAAAVLLAVAAVAVLVVTSLLSGWPAAAAFLALVFAARWTIRPLRSRPA